MTIKDLKNDLEMTIKDLKEELKIKDFKKDLEIQKLNSMKEMEIQKLNSMKEMEIQYLKEELKIQKLNSTHQLEMTIAAHDSIISQSACTSRGIFEYYLKGVFSEFKLKGAYNSRAACDELVKCKFYLFIFLSKLKLLFVDIKSGESTQGMYFTRLLKDSVISCNFDPTKLYDFYGTLSDKVHGQPWDGPDVRIVAGLSTEQQCLIKKLAESLRFSVNTP
jgi:hypothetical protein